MKDRIIAIVGIIIPVIISLWTGYANRPIISCDVDIHQIKVPYNFPMSDVETKLDSLKIPRNILQLRVKNSGDVIENQVRVIVTSPKIVLLDSVQKITPYFQYRPILSKIDSVKTIYIDSLFADRTVNINFVPDVKWKIEVLPYHGKSLVLSNDKLSTSIDFRYWGIYIIIGLFFSFILFCLFKIIKWFICRYKKNHNKQQRVYVVSYGKPRTDGYEPQSIVFGDNRIVITYAAKRDVIFSTWSAYDILVNFKIKASSQDIFLERMYLCNDNGLSGNYQMIKELKIIDVIPDLDINILQKTPDEVHALYQQVKHLQIKNYKISKKSQIDLSILDRIEAPRYPDGYEDVPIKGWSLKIIYNIDQELIVPFSVF